MVKVPSTPVSIDNHGIALRGELKSPGAGVPLVVLCHGIPLAKPDPSDGGYPALADTLFEEGYASLFVNFRGVGQSGGSFFIGGWYEDLKEIMKYAHSMKDTCGGIYVAGFSAGGALAIRYAGEQGGVEGVAAFAAPAWFTRIFPPEHFDEFFRIAREIGIVTDPDFPPSTEWCVEDMRKNDAIDYVANVSPRPLLLVHGDTDDVIPLDHTSALFETAGQPKEMIVLDSAGHRLRREPAAVMTLLEWLGRVSSSTG